MSKITITKERVDGQAVYAWAVGDKGGYCATEADARNDARIASERTGHTQGEWYSPEGSTLIRTDKTIIAEIAMVPESKAAPYVERVANARLIAAAPELLASAKAMRDRWSDDDETTKEQYAAYESLCAAIAKAEGAI